VKLYLDTSALVKLVQRESESAVLRRYLRSHRDDVRLTSALARTELLRAVAAGGPEAIAHARRLLARVNQVALDRDVLDDAGTLAPGTALRSLDAIHLAAARTAAPDLRAVVTYDARMAAAATAISLLAIAPA